MSGEVVIAGGAGDNAAGAAGIGTVVPGRAFLSLGNVGRAVRDQPRLCPEPGTGGARLLPLSAGHLAPDVGDPERRGLPGLGQRGDRRRRRRPPWWPRPAAAEEHLERVPLFLPYLTGERTPHNDPMRRASFFGLDQATDARGDLGWSVLAGVAYAFADGLDVLIEAGAEIDQISVIGGGARSPLWGRILASVLGRPLTYHSGGEVGPAGGRPPGRGWRRRRDAEQVCAQPPVDHVVEPEAELGERLSARLAQWRGFMKR